MLLSSTIVLKRKKEMLYVSMDFKNGLTKAASVVSAMAEYQLEKIKQQAPPTSSKMTTLQITRYKW